MQQKIIDKLSTLIILNLLYFVSFITVIGAGASDAALNAILIRIVRMEDGYIHKDFKKFFFQDFLKNSLAFLSIILIPIILVASFLILPYTPLPFYLIDILRNIGFVFLVLFTIATTFVSPLNARYKNTLKNSFHNSVLLSYKHFIQALLIRLIQCIPIALFFILQKQLFVWITLMIFILPSLTGYLCAMIFNSVFSKYDKLN